MTEVILNLCRGDRTRTCDSLVPNQERYQLRYTPLQSRVCFLIAGAKVGSFFEIAKTFLCFFSKLAVFNIYLILRLYRTHLLYPSRGEGLGG